MEDARKNHNVLLTVIGVTTLLVAMVGATLSYHKYWKNQYL